MDDLTNRVMTSFNPIRRCVTARKILLLKHEGIYIPNAWKFLNTFRVKFAFDFNLILIAY